MILLEDQTPELEGKKKHSFFLGLLAYIIKKGEYIFVQRNLFSGMAPLFF
jgi:hypothetical protein